MSFVNVVNNSYAIAVAKRRWLRRLDIFDIPNYGYVNWKAWEIYLYLKDWKGPSYHVLNFGLETYENSNFQYLKKVCAAEKEAIFFDVGANIGIFSFRLVKELETVKAFSFEPEPHASRFMSETIKANNISRVQLINYALSDSDRTSTIYFDGENHGGHSLSADSIIQDGSVITQEIPVATTTLDHFVEVNPLRKISAIKIDVQRHEASVLRGAKSAIAKYRPVILAEFYIEDLQDPNLFDVFESAGNYLIFDPIEKRFFPLAKYSDILSNAAGEYYRDLFIVPSEKSSIFREKID